MKLKFHLFLNSGLIVFTFEMKTIQNECYSGQI